MRILTLVVLFFSTAPSFAMSQIIFKTDGTTATVMLQSRPGDLDAATFYDAVNLPPEDINGKWTKKFTFADAAGNKILDVVCAFSKLIKDTGTCVLILHASEGVTMQPASNLASYLVQGTEAERLGKFFVQPPGSTDIYRSSDGHLSLRATVSPSTGRIETLTTEYR
jgi:hypothetical protein